MRAEEQTRKVFAEIRRDIHGDTTLDQSLEEFFTDWLNGKKHEVFTGLALLDASSGRLENGAAVTTVWMKELSALHIRNYVATGEPFDKAGAYAIQGFAGLFIDRLEGCYTNVVGLPLSLLYDLFMRSGYTIWLNRKDGDNAQ